jgi:O-antigen ligase
MSMTMSDGALRWMPAAAFAAIAACIGLVAGVQPQLAIGVSLGLGFVLLALANLTAGLIAFTFLSFVALVPTAGGSALSFLKIAGLLLGLSWLSSNTWRGERGQANFLTEYSTLTYTVICFLGWVGLSQLWAQNPAATITDFSRYALNAVLFLIVFSAIRKQSDVSQLMAAVLAGAVVAAAYGMLHPASTDQAEVDRLSGTIGNANELAAVLVVGAALGLGLVSSLRNSPTLRLLAISASMFCVLAIFLTLSRTGLVAMGFALLASVAIAGRWRARATIVTLLVAFAAVGYFTAIATPQARERVTEAGNGTGRTDLWTIGVRMVKDKPLIGVGAGNFSTVSVHYLLQPGALTRSDFIVDTPKVAHNTYLEILAETGIVGFSLFVTILLLCISYGIAAVRNFSTLGDRRMEALAQAMLVALFGLLAADFFGSEQFQKILWLLLALCPAMLAISRQALASADPRAS